MAYTPDDEARISAFLEKFDLTFAAFEMLVDAAMACHMPLKLLIRRAVSSNRRNPPQRLTPEQAGMAVGELLCKGMLQIVSEDTQRYIRFVLESSDAENKHPASGVPQVGDIDLTLYGAQVYALIQKDVFPSVATSVASLVELEDGSRAVYSNDLEYAKFAVDDLGDGHNSTIKRPVASPQECGPWFERWWRLHEGGWKILVIDER